MKIYLTSDGDYSDYHITGAYSTRELAHAALRAQEGPEESAEHLDSYVSEFEVDQPPTPVVGAYVCWVNPIGQSGTIHWRQGEDPHKAPWQAEGVFWGTGTSKEHARRSAEELRRRKLVLTGWVPTPPGR